MSSTVITPPAPSLVIAPPGFAAPTSAGSRRERRLTALTAALVLTIVLVSLLIVIVADDRPSFLAPLTSAGFFPHWLAGPLGGLWPQFPRSLDLLEELFTYGAILMYGAYIGVIVNAHRLRARWLMAGVVAAHIVYFLSPPMTLTDVGNYINYGRMEIVHHLNPYTTIPIVEPHTDPSYLISNWHHLLSPYGPLFTILTFALVPLGVAASFWTIKAILMACSLAVVVLVARSASLLGHDPRRAIAVVGLNPIVLLWGMGGDHNDPVTMLFLVTGIYLLLRGHVRRTRVVARRNAAVELDRRLAAPPRPPRPPAPPSPLLGVHAAFGSGEPERLPLLGARLLIPPVAPGEAVGMEKLRSAVRSLLGHRPWRTESVADGYGAANGHRRGNGHGGGDGHDAGNGHGAGVGHDGSQGRSILHPLHGARGERFLARPAQARGEHPTAHFLAPMTLRDRLTPMSTEFLAGVSLVLAVAVKASAAILLPVILCGLLRTPRRALNLIAGMAFAAVVIGAISLAVFGPHLPDISTQDTLVIALSVPNLLGLALGQGGETAALHTIIQLALVLAIVAASIWAWRRRTPAGAGFLAPAGWATLALLMALPWVLPWYVLWLLPFAALARSKVLTRAVLVFGAYLLLAWCPLSASWQGDVGFSPSSSQIGVQHAAEAKALLH